MLSRICTDPPEAEIKMKRAINWGIQLSRRTVRMIKLERLLRKDVGTGKVEKLAAMLASEARGGRKGEAEERERSSGRAPNA